MATRKNATEPYVYSDVSLDARLNEARNALVSRELDLFRIEELTPDDAVDTERLDRSRAEADRVKAVYAAVKAEADARPAPPTR